MSQPSEAHSWAEANRALAERWFHEVWNERHDDTLNELLRPETEGHLEGEGVVDVSTFKSIRQALLSSFSDLHLEVLDTVAERDMVVVRWRMTGTHDGDGLGIPASRLPVDVPGITWLAFQDGKVTRGWDAWNQGDFLRRLQSSSPDGLRRPPRN